MTAVVINRWHFNKIIATLLNAVFSIVAFLDSLLNVLAFTMSFPIPSRMIILHINKRTVSKYSQIIEFEELDRFSFLPLQFPNQDVVNAISLQTNCLVDINIRLKYYLL